MSDTFDGAAAPGAPAADQMPSPVRSGRYASIDIGTVTCRLLVADVGEDGRVHELARGYRITNLGEGVAATGVLKPEAMLRVDAAIAEFLEVIAHYEQPKAPVAMRCVATSASRDAANAGEFSALLARRGVRLSVIPGEQEAALSFSGASGDFPGERILVVDIGGGSTEVVAGEASRRPLRARSFNVGCRRVTERFFADDPPTRDQIEAAETWIADEMGAYFEELRALGFAGARVVAVAGTATSVVSMRDKMETYDAARVHGAVVQAPELEALYRELAQMTCEQRKGVVGLDPGRAPVIVAGLAILRVVLCMAGAASFTASESDILQGVILSIAAE